jgi:hypothetical protein
MCVVYLREFVFSERKHESSNVVALIAHHTPVLTCTSLLNRKTVRYIFASCIENQGRRHVKETETHHNFEHKAIQQHYLLKAEYFSPTILGFEIFSESPNKI